MSYVRNDSLMYQMPVHFGPCVTPRQNKEGKHASPRHGSQGMISR